MKHLEYGLNLIGEKDKMLILKKTGDSPGVEQVGNLTMEMIQRIIKNLV